MVRALRNGIMLLTLLLVIVGGTGMVSVCPCHQEVFLFSCSCHHDAAPCGCRDSPALHYLADLPGFPSSGTVSSFNKPNIGFRNTRPP